MATAQANNLHVSRSAERALRLLELVATEGSLPLTEAAKATDIPVSTTLRHLRALVDSGWLQRDQAGEYSAGPNLLRIAVQVFRFGPYSRLIALAQPHLDSLAEEIGESVYLAVRDGDVAVYLAMTESTKAIRHVGWVGKRVPLKGTAVGEALSAKPNMELDPLPVFTASGTIEPDVAAVATPIVERATGEVVGAFSALGPTSRLSERAQEAAQALRKASMKLRTDLHGLSSGN